MKKNILVTVAGTTPQIITETLYYLLIQEKNRIDEIYVLTTARGEKMITEQLIARNLIFKLYWDFQLPANNLPPLKIVCLLDENGQKLTDVRTLKDNQQAAAQIIDFIRQLTNQEDNQLHCSIAGGRKTMSSYMALALNLFGRAQDKLSHVLVYPEEIENDKSFYYPTPNDKKTRIDLAYIPFIRLREKLMKLFGDISHLNFEDLARICNSDLQDLERLTTAVLKKDEQLLVIKWGEKSFQVKFQPKLFSIYRFLFEHVDPQIVAENNVLKELYCNEYGHGKESIRFDSETIKKDISDINRRVLGKTLPEFLVVLLQIKNDNQSPVEKYFIPLSFEHRFVE